MSVDVDPGAARACRDLVSDGVQLHTEDSVRYLKKLCDSAASGVWAVDLL